MDRNLELKRYASGFSYFLLKHLEKSQLEKIRHIILFGSVAQGRAGNDSDVDIFIDVSLPPSGIRRFRSLISRKRDSFLLSNEGLSYKESGVYNTINITVGDLSQWDEMKKSISASGIVLYGQYRTGFTRKNLCHSVIFFWEAEGKRRGAFLNKLYGYSVKGKRYPGSIQKLKATKIGKSAAIVPAESSQKLMKIMENYKINYKTIEVFV